MIEKKLCSQKTKMNSVTVIINFKIQFVFATQQSHAEKHEI